MQLGTMGRYTRHYKPSLLNAHIITNSLFGLPSRPAFSPGAIVIQQKKIPDVSFYQEIINFERMRKMTDALIIRAGQNTWVDMQFKNNWRECKRLGISRGSYWFYDDRKSPGQQAEIWAELLRYDPPEMEIWCDWEIVYGGPYGGLKNVVAFMQRMEQLLPGVEIGLYTGYFFFREHSNAVTDANQYAYLKKKKLFLGWYTENAANVLVPNPFKSLFLWQFGTPAVGAEYGVATKEIDMSYINMTEVEFQKIYRGEVVPPPEPGDPMYGRVLVTLNIRKTPNQDFGSIGVLQTGDIVESNLNSNGWWRLTKITRNGQAVTLPGPDCYAYEGASNGYIVPIDPPKPVRPFTLQVEGFKPFRGELEPA